MTQTSSLPDFFAELKKITNGDVRTDLYNRTLYSTDASLYEVMPHGVLLPKHIEEVEAAIELAYKYKVPVLPRGGGSSLAGQTVNEALVIDMSRHLDQILELNVEEQWVRTQPGVVLDQLNAYLKPKDLQFGPDPASSNRAVMGGIVGNNSTGSHSVLYGMAVDHVLETKVLLSDGSQAHFKPLTDEELAQHRKKKGLEGQIYRDVTNLLQDERKIEAIRQGTPKHWRRCGGYNLARFVQDGTIDFFGSPDPSFNLSSLMVGSEGTLGTFTEMKLNLVKSPARKAMAIVEFDEAHAALEAVPHLLETSPSAIELLDNMGLTLAETVPQYARLMRSFLNGSPFCLLVVEYYGQSEAELRHKMDELKRKIKQASIKSTAVTPIFDPIKQANVWKVRKVGLGLLMSTRSDYKPIAFIEDTAVPVEHLASYIPRIEQFCAELGTKMVYYAHASAGCLHIRPMVNTKLQSELDKIVEIQKFTLSLMHEYGGALSSEHGDGRARSWLNKAFYGDELYALYGEVKHLFDPHNLCNPGNIVEGPSPQTDLRYGPSYQSKPITLHLDFSSDGGFAGAIEMCNGAGVCRKVSSGGMCPSFMATHEEEDSTRGRANMLRSALAGRIPHDELVSERMYEVLELCVSCKACKSECPSSVDMAKIKTEFLAQYYDVHAHPWRDHLFANFTTLAKWASGPLAPLFNVGSQLPPVKWAIEKAFGISAQRTLPQFAGQSFLAWFDEHTPRTSPASTSHQVVLFPDTLNSYVYPQVAIAATEVLEAVGCQVILADASDSGRPAYSKGLLNKSRELALAVLDALTPFAERNLPIIFLEPSDLSCVTDDYEGLLPNETRIALVASQSVSFEQYLAQQIERDEVANLFHQQPKQVLLHGHCHQKALFGTDAMKQLSGAGNIQEIPSGCCGMAGSFGYEKENYDISEKIGSEILFPAVKKAAADSSIVACGVSCRHQLAHFTNKKAVHWVESVEVVK